MSARDPVLREIIRAHPGISLARRGGAFGSLARSIIGQQISVKAAQSVWDRLAATAGEVNVERILALRPETLRSCGLSLRKAEYLLGLAQSFAGGSLQVDQWPHWEDEAIIEDLVRVRGIGRWTAEMFLMFHLLRPNVLPLGDLGLQQAIRMHYGKGRDLSARRMRALGDTWTPWCTVATWYLWRSLNPIPVEY